MIWSLRYEIFCEQWHWKMFAFVWQTVVWYQRLLSIVSDDTTSKQWPLNWVWKSLGRMCWNAQARDETEALKKTRWHQKTACIALWAGWKQGSSIGVWGCPVRTSSWSEDNDRYKSVIILHHASFWGCLIEISYILYAAAVVNLSIG